LAEEALSVLMGGGAHGNLGLEGGAHGDLGLGGGAHGDLGLVCVQFLSWICLILLLVQDEGDFYSPHTISPVDDDVIHSASPTLVTPFPSTAGSSSKVKAEATSVTPSRASTPRSRTTSKRSIQDAFAEGTAKDNQLLERLGTQKHERAIGELELKRRKLENKAMEKQHQREREREQHQIRMMQMQMMMTQNRQGMPTMMQGQNRPLERFGLMAELNDATVPSDTLSSYPGM
jgi:hypothetical protein